MMSMRFNSLQELADIVHRDNLEVIELSNEEMSLFRKLVKDSPERKEKGIPVIEKHGRT